MIERTEFLLKTPDTKDTLFLQSWKESGGPADMILLITHGVQEHSESHARLGEELARNRVHVFAWDLPGHGRSYGQRGYVSSFEEYVDRLHFVINEIHKDFDGNSPFFLFGHSMGGLVTLKYILKHSESKVRALCLSSPALGVSAEVPKFKDQAARILHKLAPRITMGHRVEYTDLTRDREWQKTYGKDPLRHSRFSAPLYVGMLEAMADVLQRAHQIRKPVLLQAAGMDKITDVLAAQELFQKLGSQEKQLKIYPDSYHEIFNDLNRKEVIDDLLNYLRQFHHA